MATLQIRTKAKRPLCSAPCRFRSKFFEARDNARNLVVRGVRALFILGSPGSDQALVLPRMETSSAVHHGARHPSLSCASAGCSAACTSNSLSRQSERVSLRCTAAPTPIVKLSLLRLNLTQLQAINHIDQTFTARYFLHLIVEGGAQQLDLAADLDPNSSNFPNDGSRPGIGWYLSQLDFPTARDLQYCTKKIVMLDDVDLHITVDVCGTFYESMELEQYPLDVQRLTFVVSVNCAREGMVPILFDESSLQKAAISVNLKTFALANVWKLFPSLVIEPTKVDPMPARTYPALSVSALAERKPFTLFANVVVPVSSLTALSGLSFLLPVGDYGNRLSLSSTMMLTSAAYKLVVADRIPEVHYLTLLDKYILGCYLMMALVVVEAAIVAMWAEGEDTHGETSPPVGLEATADLTAGRLGDRIAAFAFCGSFLLFHLYVLYKCWCRPRLMQEVIDGLRGGRSFSDAYQLQRSFSAPNDLSIFKQYAERTSVALDRDSLEDSPPSALRRQLSRSLSAFKRSFGSSFRTKMQIRAAQRQRQAATDSRSSAFKSTADKSMPPSRRLAERPKGCSPARPLSAQSVHLPGASSAKVEL